MQQRKNYNRVFGQTFGRLRAEQLVSDIGRAKWVCTCTCGNTKVILEKHLLTGHSKSCGCISREILRQRNYASRTHGRTNTKEYDIWHSMLERCRNPKRKDWIYYGAQGTSVCARWESFENFFADMGECPPKHSIDRIDVFGNYTPENCRWATYTQQNRNKKNNRLVTLNGKTQCVAAWTEELNLNRSTIQSRLGRGIPAETALLTPIQQRNK